MKSIKKVLALVMATMATFSCVGCGGGANNGGVTVDKAKSQLYVSYFNSGYGSDWLTAASKRFEAMYADYSFEEGKLGVQIVPVPEAYSDMSSIMATGPNSAVFFCELFNKSVYTSTGVLADLTDAITTPLNESYGQDVTGKPLPGYAGETKSIADKFTDDELISHSTEINGGRRYDAIPYMDSSFGSYNYDADVFEKYGLYFKADNTLGAKKSTGEALGLGPDGTPNTADDGLPRTLDEMRTLITQMITYNVTPFTSWGGSFLYSEQVAMSILINSIGSETFRALMTGEGSMPNAIADVNAVNGGAYTTTAKTFDSNSAIQTLRQSASMYEVARYFYDISNAFDKKAMRWVDTTSSIYSQYQAQRDFYFGSELARDYGMLIDGTWWMIEAEKEIKDYEKENLAGKTRMDRNVLYMPLPKASEADWERTKGEVVFYQRYSNAIAVRSGLSDSQQLLAETFVRFYCTDESLVEWTKIVSQPRGLNFSITDEQYEQLTPYGKQLYSIKMADEARGYGTFVHLNNVTNNTFGLANASYFNTPSTLFNSAKGQGLMPTFYNDATIKPEAWFKGLFE